MQGSRLRSRRERANMACSFTHNRILATFLVFSTFYYACFAEKEYIFHRNIWDNDSSVTEWLKRGRKAILCNQNANGRFPLKIMKTMDANRVFVKIDYKLTSHKNVSSAGLFILAEVLKKPTPSRENEKIQLPKQRISNTPSSREKSKTIYYDMKQGYKYIQLTVFGAKICVVLHKVTVFYNVCPKNDTLAVSRTVAPRTGFIEAIANCSIKQSGRKGSVVVAKCGSDGEWRKVEDKEGGCHNDCDPGTELINDTCKVCKKNYYKHNRGTHPCMLCPVNTVSNDDHTGCSCKRLHYRSNDNGPCKGIPSEPKNLSYVRLPFNAIQLHWNVSGKDARSRRDLHFHVNCLQYYKFTGLTGPCKNLSLAEKGTNVSSSSLEVKYLLNNTNYTFSVAAFNDVSAYAGQEAWKLAKIHVHLPGKVIHDAPEDVATTTNSRLSSTVLTTPPAAVDISSDERTMLGTTHTTSSSSHGQHRETVPQKGGDETTKFAPYIGIAIGAILFIFVIIVIVHYRRKHTKKRTLQHEEEWPLNPNCPQAYVDPAKYGNPEKAVRKFAKEIDRREIKLEGHIGEGEFAKVHKGMLCRPNEPPVPVALKVLKPGSSSKNREDFLTEAAVMAQFKDLNIVALEGVVTISHPVMIITEFMHNGSLSNFLVKNKNRFTEIELLGMARGIASGMKYLARMRFVHRDLAARNVLVNENMVCKVADFGLTRELEESCQGEYVTQGGKIPIRWTAPEAYKHRRFTTASDVWSFGIVLWEIMSYADRPYGDWDNYQVMDQVTANYRLFAPTNCPKIVHQLMMECWNADRSQRPSFSDIVEMLERWIRNPYLLKDYQYVTEKDLMADRKSCVAKSIREFLEAIKMERYIENFIDFGYTELYQIQNLTEDDLIVIGIPLVGHRNKIIKSLRSGARELVLPVDV